MVTDDNGDFIIDIKIFQIISELKFNAKNKIPVNFFSQATFYFTFIFKTDFCKQSNTFQRILATFSTEILFRFSNFGFFSKFLSDS